MRKEKKAWGKTGGWKSQITLLEEAVEKADRRIARVQAEIELLEPEQYLRKQMLEERVEDIRGEKATQQAKLTEYKEKGTAPIGPLNPDLPTATGQGLGDGYGGG